MVVMTTWLGRGEKAAVGGCMGVVIKRIPLFATCTGTGNDENGEWCDGWMKMPCLSRTSVHWMKWMHFSCKWWWMIMFQLSIGQREVTIVFWCFGCLLDRWSCSLMFNLCCFLYGLLSTLTGQGPCPEQLGCPSLPSWCLDHHLEPYIYKLTGCHLDSISPWATCSTASC